MADEFTKAALYGIKTFNKKAKEKIGMMKLIELLNEYQYGVFVYENEQLRFRMGSKVKIGAEPILISKSFGFIKWLVENDKIDRYKFEVEYMDKQTLEDVYIAGAKQDELLIMILSISSSPIEDLISYLK